jgi:hypothetical protein
VICDVIAGLTRNLLQTEEMLTFVSMTQKGKGLSVRAAFLNLFFEKSNNKKQNYGNTETRNRNRKALSGTT